MHFFRSIAIVLPQILILLLVGAMNDWLGGWNQTDDAMGTVLILFLLNPIMTLGLLTVEIMRCYQARTGERGWRFFFWIVLAIGLFIEALATDFFILTQLRM